VEECTFAGARFAYQRKTLAARNFEVQTGKDHQVRSTGAIPLLQAHRADQDI